MAKIYDFFFEISRFTVGLHDISFQQRYRDVHICDSHIAGCAIFSILIVRAGPSLYGAPSRILFGGPSVPPIWLLSKLDYSHTINLTHPLSVLFVVAVLLTSYHCLPGMFLPFCDF